MAQRMIQLSLRDVELDELEAYCEPARIVSVAPDMRSDPLARISMIVSVEDSEAVMDRLEGNKDLDWRELENSGFGTYVRGAVGRVGALGLLDRSWEGRLVSYSLTESGLREIGE